jgi:hypothetical protein
MDEFISEAEKQQLFRTDDLGVKIRSMEHIFMILVGIKMDLADLNSLQVHSEFDVMMWTFQFLDIKKQKTTRPISYLDCIFNRLITASMLSISDLKETITKLSYHSCLHVL